MLGMFRRSFGNTDVGWLNRRPERSGNLILLVRVRLHAELAFVG